MFHFVMVFFKIEFCRWPEKTTAKKDANGFRSLNQSEKLIDFMGGITKQTLFTIRCILE